DGGGALFIEASATNMKRTLKLFIIGCAFLCAVLFAVTIVRRIRTQDGNKSSDMPRTSETGCLSEASLENVLIDFARGRFPNGDQAGRKFFVDEAGKSAVCRENVIKTVMATIDRPDLDYTREPTNYAL